MKRLRQSLLALLVGFALFVNVVVATPNAGAGTGMPAIYLSIAAGLVAVTLLLRPRRRTSALVGVGVMGYVAVRIGTTTFLADSAAATYAIAAVEVALLLLLVLSAHRVAKAMREVTHMLAHLAAGGGDPEAVTDPVNDVRVRREMTRSRRYHRPLSVVLLEPAERSLQDAWPQLVEQARDAFVRRYVTSKTYAHIGRHLRMVDLMFEDVGRGRFVLLCPEARSDEIARQVERIRSATMAATGVRLDAGWASFPDDAVTFEELLRVADAHLRGDDSVRHLAIDVGSGLSGRSTPVSTEPG